MPEIVDIYDIKTNSNRPIPLPHGARVEVVDGHPLVRLHDDSLLMWRALREWWRERGIFLHAEEGSG